MCIAIVGIADSILLPAQNLTTTIPWMLYLAVVLFITVAIVYQKRIIFISILCNNSAQYFAFTWLIGLFTYGVASATPYPLMDEHLIQADTFFGFNWVDWFTFVNSHPFLHKVLEWVYMSPAIQLSILLLSFSYFNNKRLQEFMLTVIISLLLTTSISYIIPAVGAASSHGMGIEPWRDNLLALRDHTLGNITAPLGIISFPSFHTILALLLIYTTRGYKCHIISIIINALMILSALTEGAHYLVDIFGGVATTIITIYIVNRLQSLSFIEDITGFTNSPLLKAVAAGRKQVLTLLRASNTSHYNRVKS
jgi:membrane-associated phospholipid phosphatase